MKGRLFKMIRIGVVNIDVSHPKTFCEYLKKIIELDMLLYIMMVFVEMMK